MCGICGGITWSPKHNLDEKLLQRMCRLMIHRGPDDEGAYVGDWSKGQVGLGNRRLSIIDVEGGHQPIANEDGSVHVVCNGEIYNFRDLREQLVRQGHELRTRCDTEVIVHLYEDRGIEFLHELRGMFALALWDGNEERLVLARDRLGQKPLYYYRDNERLVFASSIKSILEAPGIPREVDREALHDYLTFQYVPHPLTMFRGIKKLPPAHYLVFDKGEIRIERYWRPEFDEDHGMLEHQCADHVRGLLQEATELRMISDVPLGAFLSGGIDSSIVVGLMSRLSKDPVKTFSIGFEEKKYDELEYARAVADEFRTDHKEFVVRPNAVEIIPELVRQFDEPFADSSAIPTYYVSKMTSEFVKVALTGDAGDECFAGYPRYRAVKIGELVDKMPKLVKGILSGAGWQGLPASVEQKTFRRRVKKFLAALARDPAQRYMMWISIFDEDSKRFLYTDDLAAEMADRDSFAFLKQYYDMPGRTDFLGRTTFVDMMTYLPCDLLTKVDVTSMAHSLEARSPFLDHKLIEFVATIPTHFKLRKLKTKHILKRAFGDLLPECIVKRPKMGFGVPIAEWFRKDLADYVRDVLLDARATGRGIFKKKSVEQLVNQHINRQADHGYRLWALLMLELWHREFIDSNS
ncbi:MAG: asparagine synthase (glutamine-hydrolyzing) [Planctomycetes bacterium]|nr:asparagine synthase (glutamine-hydrolyzing) [Planctomycetota bacterium]